MSRRRSLSPCAHRGCPTLTRDTYCDVHKPEPWAGRRGFEGYKGDWLRIRAQVLREEPYCRQCGRPSVTVDHIVPKARGGTDDRSNLQALCAKCHTKAHAGCLSQDRLWQVVGQREDVKPSAATKTAQRLKRAAAGY